MNTEPPIHEEIYTVSQLNTETRLFLEEAFGRIWVMGEISNLVCPSSGHCYFSLKDNKAQIRCAMFRNSRRRANFIPENGQQVFVRGKISLYEPRGDYQLIVSQMQLAGSGALQIAFEKLKQKLSAEGLFDESHKKPLPAIPSRIGVVTSPTGAAIHDILTVLKRRFASIPVIIYPTLVQGERAANDIVKAIQIANRRQECDILILARGGGSLEDLWPFNEEIVARAIFASEIPIVSGVGHEVDITIADFVADKRAPTPSAAAECVSPNKIEWQQRINNLYKHLSNRMHNTLQQAKIHLSHLHKRLRHPGQRLREQMQRLDQIEQSLMLALKNHLSRQQSILNTLTLKISAQSPKLKIEQQRSEINTLSKRLMTTMQNQLRQQKQQIQHLANTLDTVSPLKTLQRGYAILTDKKSGVVIRKIQDTQPNAKIVAQVGNGQIECLVEKVIESSEGD